MEQLEAKYNAIEYSIYYDYDGGDAIKFIDWLAERGTHYPINIHTMNPVGRENMRAIIQKNGWTEVF